MMENLAANELSNQANTLVQINKIQMHTHGEKTYDLCTSIVATKVPPICGTWWRASSIRKPLDSAATLAWRKCSSAFTASHKFE